MSLSECRATELSLFVAALTEEEADHVAQSIRNRPLPGSDPTIPTAEEVVYMNASRVIDAIKSVRMRSRLGLREAKDLVNMWRANPRHYGLLL